MNESPEDVLRKLPQQEILALATGLFAIARAQEAAGKQLTDREKTILREAAEVIPHHPLQRKSP
jgi:hypothetical protein